MKLLVKIGDRFEFNELPDSTRDYEVDKFGIVVEIFDELLCVDHFGRKVFFDIDGSSWSECGQYKRETIILDWSSGQSSVSEKESLEKEFNTVFLSETLREQIFDTAKNFADISEDHPQANSLGLNLHSFYEELASVALNAYNEGQK